MHLLAVVCEPPSPSRPMRAVISITAHSLNAINGILSIAILALTAHATVLKDELNVPDAVKVTGSTILYWPGCGGLVDFVLFLVLWLRTAFTHQSVRRLA